MTIALQINKYPVQGIYLTCDKYRAVIFIHAH